MLLKRLEKPALFAWSPKNITQLSLVAGTPAHQVDASFNTSSNLDFYELNVKSSDEDINLPPFASVATQHRFRKVVWGAHDSLPFGVVAAGSDDGILSLYDPSKIKTADKSAQIFQAKVHAGSVRALDLNKFKTNLLATGASDSELFVWDVNKPNVPMAPGPKTQPVENVMSVNWNCQVEHILCSLMSSRALIWDLRKNDAPILRIADSGPKVQWGEFAWHPNVATSICLASEDDHFPYVQHWDLRYANAPLIQLEGHMRGILSVSWNASDADVLLTCGKDNKIYTWNPNTGQFLAEIPYHGRQWPFQVSWCPKNPFLFGCASLDGFVSVVTVVGSGSGYSVSSLLHSPKIADSFPGTDFSYHPIAAQQKSLETLIEKPVVLPVPFKFMRCPIRASFAFGGRLISFDEQKPPQTTVDASGHEQPVVEQRTVFISQVLTEPQFADNAKQLHNALVQSGFSDFSSQKVSTAKDDLERNLWAIINARFERESRDQILDVLGCGPATFEKQHQRERVSTERDLNVPELGLDGRIDALNLASSEDSSESVSTTYTALPVLNLGTDTDAVEGRLCRAIVLGEFETAVEVCIENGRWTDAVLLSSVSGDECLQTKTSRRYLQSNENPVSKLLSMLMRNRWNELMASIDLKYWRDAFAALITFTTGDQKIQLAEKLGKRLETELGGKLRPQAGMCYAAAGMVDLAISCLSSIYKPTESISGLQMLVEYAFALQGSLGSFGQNRSHYGSVTANLFCQYATALADQGCVQIALDCLGLLPEPTDKHLIELKDRLSGACGLPVQKQTHANAFGRRPSMDVDKRRPSLSQYNRSAYPVQEVKSPAYYPQHCPNVVQPPPGPPAMMGGSRMSHLNVLAPAVSTGPPVAHMSQSMLTGSAVRGRGRYPTEGQASTADQYSQYALAQYGAYPSAQSAVGPSIQSSVLPSMGHTSSAFPASTGGPSAASGFGPQHNQFSSQQMGVPQMSAPSGKTAPPVMAVPPIPAPDRQHAPWNDPPLMTARKATKPVPSISDQQPITQPVYGALPETNAFEPYPQQPQSFMQPGVGHHGMANTMQKATAASTEKFPAVQLPAEYQHIKQAFDRLIQLCIQRADSVRTRKKLEDAAEKLEAEMYPSLSSQKLSQSAIGGLQELVHFANAHDYNSALAVYNTIIQGPDFAQLVGFMPSVKLILTFAWQLGVSL